MTEERVRKIIAEEQEKQRRRVSELPPSAWAAETWERLTKAGVTDGTAPRREMTRQEGVTIIDRFSTRLAEELKVDKATVLKAFEDCLCSHGENAPPHTHEIERVG